MSIIGIDIGSTTIKIIEYKDKKIINNNISMNRNIEEVLEQFIQSNNIDINNIERIVLTGIGADKIKENKYNIPMETVEEFVAVSTGGLQLANKEEALIVSIGTGTALVKANKEGFRHLGGTGVGAGTLMKLCKRLVNADSFDEIVELSKKGDLSKIDIRICDRTDKEIDTLPPDLTLSNFGNLAEDATDSDIALGILHMIFEIIAMMAVFATKNDKVREVILIGNIATIPCVKQLLKQIEELHNITFIIPKNAQYAVVIGAIESLTKNNY